MCVLSGGVEVRFVFFKVNEYSICISYQKVARVYLERLVRRLFQ